MRMVDYPKCCKARVLCDFGAGHLIEDDRLSDMDDWVPVRRHTEKEIKDFIDERIQSLIALGVQVIFACPTNHQPEAIKALQEYGFYGADEEDLKKTNRSSVHLVGFGNMEHYMVPMFYLIQGNNGN